MRARRSLLPVLAAAIAIASVAIADEPARKAEPEKADDFGEIARVLLSPRCRNCHPAGDAPLHGDDGSPHGMNVSRRSPEAGLECTACHREHNGGRAGSPPGVPNWRMPGREMPMVFENRTAHELCTALKDPKQNGGKTLAALIEHVESDRLVLWGWDPGPGRTAPPIAHDAFVAHVRRWVQGGAPCPDR